MSTRRNFLQSASAAAGIAFVGCNVLCSAHAQTPITPRRKVVINGRRVKTVDIHAHCAVPEAMALMGMKVTPASLLIDDDRVRVMDQQGIDIAALSINPFWYAAEREVAEQIIKIQNERMSELCAKSERFVAFASVALQYPDLAVRQLEDAVKKLGLRGTAIGGSVNGEELSNPKFHPFWQKAEELGVTVFIHPQGILPLSGRLKGNGFLDVVIGNPTETTIALSHLIFEGTLDRFPGLKICAAHGGGYLPFYAHRSDHVCSVFPDRCKEVTLKKKPSEYLKQLYFDSIVFTPQALKYLIEEVGVTQIALGTDSPYPWTPAPIDDILNTQDLSDADRIAILGQTAMKLLGIH